MKKLPKYLSVIGSTMLVWGAFLLPSYVSAQTGSGHFVLLSQGQLGQESVYYPSPGSGSFPSGGVGYLIDIGNGYVGSTTGAFLTASTTIAQNTDFASLRILGGAVSGSYSDSACSYSMRNFANGTYTGSTFRQLVRYEETNSGCIFRPDYFYRIVISYVGIFSANPQGFSFFGTPVNNKPDWVVSTSGTVDPNVAIPYFSIVSDGFQITPTEASSGIFLSGSRDFCNSAFASTTGIGATIGNGFCTALGFLFVPTPESLQQFSLLSDSLQVSIPFSYFYDFKDILESGSASSSDNFSVLSLDLRGTGVASTSAWNNVLPGTFAYLSSTTITAYVSPTLYDLIFFLMRSAIWIAVLFHIYHRLVPKHATHV